MGYNLLILNRKRFNQQTLNIIKEKLSEIAEKLGILNVLNKYPVEVSGGERQRCACARAIINQPALVLADEPTGSLDSGTSKALMESIRFMNENMGSTILLVTHDIFVASYASRVLFLKDGMLYKELYIEGRGAEEKFKEIMENIVEQEGN